MSRFPTSRERVNRINARELLHCVIVVQDNSEIKVTRLAWPAHVQGEYDDERPFQMTEHELQAETIGLVIDPNQYEIELDIESKLINDGCNHKAFEMFHKLLPFIVMEYYDQNPLTKLNL